VNKNKNKTVVVTSEPAIKGEAQFEALSKPRIKTRCSG